MFEELEQSIGKRLKKQFHKDIFESSIKLLNSDIYTRFSNFATNIRELTREILQWKAADEEVKKLFMV